MLEETSVEARTIFLLKFTEQLIKNSKGTELLRLEEIIRKKIGLPSLLQIPRQNIDERVREVLTKKPTKTFEEMKEPTKRITPLPQNEQKFISLTVPRPKFQENVPSPVQENINFGKIDALTKDPNVKLIEFQENQKIIVEGGMGRKFTGIELTQSEVKDLLNEFSSKTKIPLNNGVNKIALRNYLITAIVSEQGIKNFLIKKTFESPFINLRPPSPMY